MMNKPILIDVSLTGGRGPAKQAYELILDLQANKIPYLVLSDRLFARKLNDIGLQADYIVDTDLTEPDDIILGKFEDVVNRIDFSLLVKFGARVAGPLVARKLLKPYVLVDGGLPDSLSDEENLYHRQTFEQAKAVYLTSQFPWNYPQRTRLTNLNVCCYPISQTTFAYIAALRSMSKIDILKRFAGSNLDGNLPTSPSDLLIDLMMTGDIFEPSNRVSYGGWLTARQYDQCVGFVRRLFIDLAKQTSAPIWIFVDTLVADLVRDILSTATNLHILTFSSGWDYKTEIALQAAADITISRATNYQPYVAALCKGGNVTSPVPADGYMDEDTAGIQYDSLGLTKLICYDDEAYLQKLLSFSRDQRLQSSISSNLKANRRFVTEKNFNKLFLERISLSPSGSSR